VSRQQLIFAEIGPFLSDFTATLWIFRRLADAAMIEKASSEVRGTLCKLRRSSVMVQEADP
jgi:hypothetical protein